MGACGSGHPSQDSIDCCKRFCGIQCLSADYFQVGLGGGSRFRNTHSLKTSRPERKSHDVAGLQHAMLFTHDSGAASSDASGALQDCSEEFKQEREKRSRDQVDPDPIITGRTGPLKLQFLHTLRHLSSDPAFGEIEVRRFRKTRTLSVLVLVAH